jgi:hypothetical protein
VLQGSHQCRSAGGYPIIERGKKNVGACEATAKQLAREYAGSIDDDPRIEADKSGRGYP